MIKRIADIILSLILGILSLPLCMILAIAIRLENKGRIIYSSPRIGLGGRRFNMLKFRTMLSNSSLTGEHLDEFQHNFKLSNDQRITKIGRCLRRHCLDEIPQFINVFKGDMSLIGPRPKLPDEIDLYENSKHELLSVLPGITGYWQVYRKNAISDEIMRSMDLYYIRNRSFVLDIKILVMTFKIIISKKNY